MPQLAPVDAVAILLLIAATLGFVNARFLKLPSSIGMTIMGAVASIIVIVIDQIFARSHLSNGLVALLDSVDLHDALFGGMLSFLLFAGALHVDLSELRRNRWPILLFSTVGVILSTMIVGAGFYGIAAALHLGLPLSWCLVFGALISPTDPVSVMAVMRKAAMPPSLQATVAGESLFNDGAGVVVFSLLLGVAINGGELHLAEATGHFLKEVLGGMVFGVVAATIAVTAMRQIDEYNIEITVTLALVLAGYRFALALGVSAPVAMAVAGLIVGNIGVERAMSSVTRTYLLAFWALIDELLNALLFLIIGLELFAVADEGWALLASALAIPLCLFARAISVGVPLLATRRFLPLGDLAFPTLVWGGLRGGISVALALSLPIGPHRAAILSATYLVVMFSVIVQGGSISRLIAHLQRREEAVT